MKKFLLLFLFLSFLMLHAQKNEPVFQYKGALKSTDATGVETINFHALITLKNGQATIYDLPVKTTFKQLTVFTVLQMKEPQAIQDVWYLKSFDTDIELTTQGIGNKDGGFYYNTAKNTSPLLVTFDHSYSKDNSGYDAQTFQLGNYSKDSIRNFNGALAEVLVYNKVLGKTSKQIISSMLALKYGITLTNGLNYIYDKNKVVYHAEEHPEFNQHIAGIGRFDKFDLYQKQAKSSNERAVLSIGLDKIYTLNEQNPTEIKDRDFMVWASNGKALAFHSQAENPLKLSDRQWRMEVTGTSLGNQPTQVKLNTSFFTESPEADKWVLYVQRKGTQATAEDIPDYYVASGKERDEIVFDGVKWDTDLSGEDVFGFALIQDLELALLEKTPIGCENPSGGVLRYQLKGGLPPYTFTLQSPGGITGQWESKQLTSKDLENLSSGTYQLEVKDRTGHTAVASYTFIDPERVELQVEKNHQLKYGKSITLDATVSGREDIAYEWFYEGTSISQSPELSISQAGVYQVTATPEKGCPTMEIIVVKPSPIRNFTVYPNSTQDGNYTIDVELEQPQDILIRITDIAGKELYKHGGQNKNRYTLKGKQLRASGIYDIVLQTPEETAVAKLIVE